jgi:hypothetical protein
MWRCDCIWYQVLTSLRVCLLYCSEPFWFRTVQRIQDFQEHIRMTNVKLLASQTRLVSLEYVFNNKLDVSD